MAGAQTRQRHRNVDTSGRATTREHRQRTSAGRGRDLEAAYKAGLRGDAPPPDDRLTPYYEDGVRDAKRQRRAKGRARRTARAKTTAKRKTRSTARAVRRDAKRLAPAAAVGVTSGLQLAGMTLGLVALYLVLTNVDTFSGVLGGVARGLQWLADPGASIPYRKE